jgi:hypothetical protein
MKSTGDSTIGFDKTGTEPLPRASPTQCKELKMVGRNVNFYACEESRIDRGHTTTSYHVVLGMTPQCNGIKIITVENHHMHIHDSIKMSICQINN